MWEKGRIAQFLVLVLALITVSLLLPDVIEQRFISASERSIPSVSGHVIFPSEAEASGVYYVSPEGDDTSPGTAEQPWRTIERAFNASMPVHVSGGSILYLHEGIHRLNLPAFHEASKDLVLDGTPAQPTLISSAPGERARIYLSENVGGWQPYTGRADASIYVADWRSYLQTNQPWYYQDDWRSKPQGVYLDDASPVILQQVNDEKTGIEFKPGLERPASLRTSQNDMIAGDFYYETDSASVNFGKLFIWLPGNANPNEKNVEVSLDYVFGFSTNYTIFHNLTIRYGADIGWAGLAVSGKYNFLDGIDSSYNSFSGLGGRCFNCTVRNSIFSFNGNSGADLVGSYTRYENNTFDSNNRRRFSPAWHCGGIVLSDTDEGIWKISNMTVRGNVFNNTIACAGAWLEWIGSGNVIEYNLFLNNSATSLKIETTNGTRRNPNIVRDNLFIESIDPDRGSNEWSPSALDIESSHFTQVYNNVFVNAAAGILMHSSSSEPQREFLQHNRAVGNIFVKVTNPHLISADSGDGKRVNNTADYSVFWQTSYPMHITPEELNDDKVLFCRELFEECTDDLAEWRAISGNDEHSVIADPRFISIAGFNFTLKSNSPALPLGINTIDTTNIPGFPVSMYQEPLAQIPQNNNVLCIYNQNSQVSQEICEYYILKRPGASILSLDIPESIFTDAQKENSNVENFRRYVNAPVLAYVDAHPELYITHLAVAKDIPMHLTQTLGGTNWDVSASLFLMYPWNFLSEGEFNSYKGSGLNRYVHQIHFNPEQYANHTILLQDATRNPAQNYTIRFMASYLSGYTLDDIKEMIDRAQEPAPDLSRVKWMIDRDTDGFSVSDAVLTTTQTNLISKGIASDNIILEQTDERPITLSDALVAYGGPGEHHANYGGQWIAQNPAILAPVASRAISTSYESYNARTFSGSANHEGQGIIADAFTSGTFGGSEYSRSFAGAAGTVREPSSSGVNAIDTLFPAYASGLTFAEAFYLSSQSYANIALGDPLMRITDMQRVGNGDICESNEECISGICSADVSGVNRCHAQASACVLDAYGSEIGDGNNTCLGTGKIIQCANGVWQEATSCDAQALCKDVLNPSFTSKINAYCGLLPGAICSNDAQCYNLNCDSDISGINRCHSNPTTCVLDAFGSQTYNNSYACVDAANKRLCTNNQWTETVSCAEGCSNGLCESEQPFTLPATLMFKAGTYYYITIPFNTTTKKVSELFADAPDLTSVYLYRNGGWRYVIKVSSVFWLGDLEVKAGESILVQPSQSEYSISVAGDEYDTPVPLTLLGEYTLIGVPYCRDYKASELLAQTASSGINCTVLMQGDAGRGPVEWWSENASYVQAGLKKDFTLRNYEAYFLRCAQETSANFTPICLGPDNPPAISINLNALNQTHTHLPIELNVSLNEPGNVTYTLDGGITNVSLTANASSTGFAGIIDNITDGTHIIIFYANDSTGKVNSTNALFSVAIAPVFTQLPEASIISVYGEEITAQFNAVDNDALTYSVNTSIVSINASGFLRNASVLAVGEHTINVTITDSAGNSNSTLYTFIIERAPSIVQTFLNHTRANISIFNESVLALNGTLLAGESEITALLDGEIIGTGASVSVVRSFADLGIHAFSVRHPETQNYTASNETWYVNVSMMPDYIPPSVTFIVEHPAQPVFYTPNALYEFNATITESGLLGTVLLMFNGTNYTASRNGDVYNVSLRNLNASTYEYRWFANDTSGNVNESEGSIYTIEKAEQSINFGTIRNLLFGEEFTLDAVSTSGLPVSFNILEGSVRITDSLLRAIGIGAVSIEAYNAGNENYNPALNVTRIFSVGKATASVSLSGLSAVYDGNQKTVSFATIPETLDVTITYNNSLAPPINAGSYPILAVVNNESYEGSAEGILVISKAEQTLTFVPLENKFIGEQIDLSASATSGLPISFRVLSGPGVILGAKLTVSGPGAIVVEASQAGDINYHPAESIERTMNGECGPDAEQVGDSCVLRCTDFTYTEWGVCSINSVQTRSVISSSPAGCTAGVPDTSRSCARICTPDATLECDAVTNGIVSGYKNKCNALGTDWLNEDTCQLTGCNAGFVQNGSECIPECTESNWQSSLNPLVCPVSGEQTKTWTKIGTCESGIQHPASEQVSCDFIAPTCTDFTYTEWSICSVEGVQNRSVITQSPEQCVDGTPILSQTCIPIICSANEEVACDAVVNGIVEGYKRKCNAEGTEWMNTNTCTLTACTTGFTKVGDVCIDITPPNVSILSPLNGNYTAVQTLLSSSVSTDAQMCWYSLDGGLVNVSTICGQTISGLLSMEGLNNWLIGVNDSNGKVNTSAVLFFVDSIPPVIAFAENPFLVEDTLFMNVSAFDVNLANITLIVRNASGIIASFNSTNDSLAVNLTGLTDGLYSIDATAYDAIGNKNSTDTHLVTVSLDITPPVIILHEPALSSILIYNTSSILINATLNEPGNVNYTLDSGITNVSMLANASLTGFIHMNNSLAEGTYVLQIYAFDSKGNVNASASQTFSLDLTAPSVSYEPGTPLSDAQLVSGILINLSIEGGIQSMITLFNASGIVNESTSVLPLHSILFEHLAPGVYSFNASARDAAGNVNRTGTRTVSVLAPPEIPGFILYGLGTNAEGISVNAQNVYVNISAQLASETNITFSLFNASGIVNESVHATPLRVINWTGLALGSYQYNVTISNASTSISTITRSITLTSPAVAESPVINVYSPENITYTTSAVLINISVSAPAGVSSILFANDSGILVYSSPVLQNVSSGSHTWQFSVNDSLGRVASTIVTFSVNVSGSQLCTPDEIVPCTPLPHGVVSGYTNKCNNLGTAWLGQSSCTISCDAGYTSDGNNCVALASGYKTILYRADLDVVRNQTHTHLYEENTTSLLVLLEGNVSEQTIAPVVIIRNNLTETRGFLLVRNLTLASGQSKTIIFGKRNVSTNGICLRDEDNVGTLQSLTTDCIRIACPGTRGRYSCTNYADAFIVTGLSNSGVTEEKLYCGDNYCSSAESCSSCSTDCGSCPISGSGSNNPIITPNASTSSTPAQQPTTATPPLGGRIFPEEKTDEESSHPGDEDQQITEDDNPLTNAVLKIVKNRKALLYLFEGVLLLMLLTIIIIFFIYYVRFKQNARGRIGIGSV
ncbi:hypothetical protein HYZ97_05010 [Candidatus Pacearchaeota archaeon]|nr:hypothetical protein [Candidatus Pacearchaeota archaeon]